MTQKTPPKTPSRFREALALFLARPFFALLVGLSHLLPRRVLLRWSLACSKLVYVLFPGVRAGLLRNAAHILGPTSTPAARIGLARGVLASFARFIVELVASPREAPSQDLLRYTSGRQHYEAARAAGKGIIAATLHMGNYELASMGLAELQENVAIVYNRDRIGFIERVRSQRRRARDLDEIVIEDSLFFGIEALRRLRENGIILLSGDQVAARDGERVPFLHGTAPFSIWPARLSRASGAPILPAFNVLGEDGQYRLCIEPPIFPREDREPEDILHELVSVFERYVRKHGDQWLMIRPFWLEG